MSTKELVQNERQKKIAKNKAFDQVNKELMFKYHETGDDQYREEFFRINERLPAYIAQTYKNNPVEMDELISIAYFGMLKAFNTFDPGLDTRFVTYAGRCMHNEILMHLRKVKRSDGREDHLDKTLAYDPNGNELTLMDVTEDVSSQYIDRYETMNGINAILEQLRSSLNDREQVILDNMLQDEDRLKQREMAEKFGISQSYVARIERKINAQAVQVAHNIGLGNLARFNSTYVKKPVSPPPRRLYTDIPESPVTTYLKELEPMKENIRVPEGTLKEKVMYLLEHHPDMPRTEMAKLIGSTASSVHTYVHHIKKEREKRASQGLPPVEAPKLEPEAEPDNGAKALADSLYRSATEFATPSEPIKFELPKIEVNPPAKDEWVPVPDAPRAPKNLDLEMDEIRGDQLQKILSDMVMDNIKKDEYYNFRIVMERL